MRSMWLRLAIGTTAIAALTGGAVTAARYHGASAPQTNTARGGIVALGNSSVSGATAPSRPARRTVGSSGPIVSSGRFLGLSPAARDLPAPPTPPSGAVSTRDIDSLFKNPLAGGTDPVVQRTASPAVTAPTVGATFDGISSLCGCLPPDPNGEVGPNHYVQMVNVHWAVYSKLGVQLMAPKAINELWATAGGECAAHNDGDPIVLYDQLANKWLLSQFIHANVDPVTQLPTEPYGQCIAISQTPDPTGAYFLYEFLTDTLTFHDYPHLAMWPDGYYMTTNEFDSSPAGATSRGAGVFAFERDKMIAGQPNPKVVMFDLGPDNPSAPNSPQAQFIGQQPADLEGLTLPPIGSPAYITEVDDESNIPAAGGVTGDAMRIWKFHVDWATPANSTLGVDETGPPLRHHQPNFTLPVPEFVQAVCVYGNGPPNMCNPQKNTPYGLDTIGDRLMFRTTYRNFGTHEALSLVHTVSASDPPPATTARNGIRWYEVRNPSGTGGSPVIRQKSTFAPADAPTNLLWRWMGSGAMDKKGDFAVGYSASGPNDFPGLRIAGRLAGDPLDTLSEAVLFPGVNSQAFPLGRWGDYSALTVDPSNDCTFWYTGEYFGGSGIPIVTSAWKTRIGNFVFPQCLQTTAVTIKAFSSRWTRSGVALSWSTGSETNTLGFNIWRSAGKSWRRVNAAVIRAKKSGGTGGATYRVLDRSVKTGRLYTYRLQSIDTKGKRSWFGVGSVPTR